MRRLVAACLLGTFLILNQGVLAYEVDTHEKLSEAAAGSSVLKTDSNVLRGLGLQFSIEDDRQQFPGSDGKPKNILNLIKVGSRFEDGLTNDCESRPRNHFYDPVRDQGLRWGIVRGEKSPDWALEDAGEITGQDFSFRNARDYLYKALTSASQTDRDILFGKTFQSLGHLVHHVQDMAQPQHVRNDIHIKAGENCWYKNIAKLIENQSLYEHYTDDNRSQLLYTGYNAVTFPKARSFWATSTGQGLAEFTNANFVSEGTNFSLGQDGQVSTNARYASPKPSGVWESVPIEKLLAERGEPVPCWTNTSGTRECLSGEVDFYWTDVQDKYLGTIDINKRAASLSIFDQDIQRYNKPVINVNDPDDPTDDTVEYRKFSLNRFNFDEVHNFLIPRAVAYSTGLLDYFFRGRLEAQDAGFTDTGISLKVKNAIDPKATPTWKDEALHAPGELALAYEYKQGNQICPKDAQHARSRA